MSLTVKTNTLLVDQPEQIAQFLASAIGLQRDIVEGNLTVAKFGAGTTGAPRPVTINSDDCLQDYYSLLGLGIKAQTRPQYTPEGLVFAIRDKHGNEYKIIEERNYQEFE